MSTDRVVIAAGLIVRDEARCIRRCLESVKPFVDRLVVVDTGSTDATMRLARRSGAEVHQIVWPDSFAAARNEMLARCDADWTLVIDADEWLAQGGAALRDWCAGPPRLGRVCIGSSFDRADGEPDAPGAARSHITRLLPRGVRYTGRIHEQVESDLPRAATPLVFGHDGYRDAQLARKRGRNHALLLRDLADQPDDGYLLFQLGKDAQGRDAHDEAAAAFERALAGTEQTAAWRHELVVARLNSLRRLGRVAEALAFAEAERTQWDASPDLHFVRGSLLLDSAAADPARAISHWLPAVRAAWTRCLEIGDRDDLAGSVEGTGSFLARRNLDVIEAQLAGFNR